MAVTHIDHFHVFDHQAGIAVLQHAGQPLGIDAVEVTGDFLRALVGAKTATDL